MDKREPIPRSLEHLRNYLEAEKLGWAEAQPGTSVVVEAYDLAKDASNTFEFRVIAKEERKNGLVAVWVELGENDFTFAHGDNRESLQLPAGTIMRDGLSCRHFPATNVYMSYNGGISVERDYSFAEAMAPDGTMLGSIYIPQVQNLYSFLPDGTFAEPPSFQTYKAKIDECRQEEEIAQEEWERRLDRLIAEDLGECFPDDTVRTEVETLINDFHTEGRYKLAVLLRFSLEDGLTEKYPSALKNAMRDEFMYAHPSIRGIDALPASSRGWNQMIREIGLRFPRPKQS